MNEEVKQALIENWLGPEDVQYLDAAIEEINKTTIKASWKNEYDITNPIKTKRCKHLLDPEDDSDSIDELIERLNESKKDGYEYVGFDDYADFLLVYKYGLENAEECAERICDTVNKAIDKIKQKQYTHERKIKRLEALRKEIDKLEKELNL